MSITPTFQGEMQLAGWNQTHNGGSKVTFWLPDDSDLEPFKGLTAKKGNTAGHRFMVVLVEIGDDELPVNSSVSNHGPEVIENCTIGANETSANAVLSHGHQIPENQPEIAQESNKYGDSNVAIEKPKGGELAKWAGILCNDPSFWKWLTLDTTRLGFEIANNTQARMRVIEICGIMSRAELDHDQEAAKIFRKEIMAKFADWKGAQ